MPVAVRPRDWDPLERAEAARLGARRHGWMVHYSLYFRRFYAFAAWCVWEPLLIEAHSIQALEDRMDAAERESVRGGGPAHVRLADLFRRSAA